MTGFCVWISGVHETYQVSILMQAESVVVPVNALRGIVNSDRRKQGRLASFRFVSPCHISPRREAPQCRKTRASLTRRFRDG